MRGKICVSCTGKTVNPVNFKVKIEVSELIWQAYTTIASLRSTYELKPRIQNPIWKEIYWIKLYPVESNELKENSAYCELQKSAEFWDQKLLRTPPSKEEFSMPMRTNKKMALVVVSHINPPTERRTWKPSKPCQTRFSFVDAPGEKRVCRAESRLKWYCKGTENVYMSRSYHPEPQSWSESWLIFISTYESARQRIWASVHCSQMNNLWNYSFKRNLWVGRVKLVFRHLKLSSDFHKKTSSRANLPKLNSLTGWRAGRK